MAHVPCMRRPANGNAGHRSHPPDRLSRPDLSNQSRPRGTIGPSALTTQRGVPLSGQGTHAHATQSSNPGSGHRTAPPRHLSRPVRQGHPDQRAAPARPSTHRPKERSVPASPSTGPLCAVRRHGQLTRRTTSSGQLGRSPPTHDSTDLTLPGHRTQELTATLSGQTTRATDAPHHLIRPAVTTREVSARTAVSPAREAVTDLLDFTGRGAHPHPARPDEASTSGLQSTHDRSDPSCSPAGPRRSRP